MRKDRDEREFYMGDTFNRGATMYFCSPDADSLTAKALSYDTDTCLDSRISALESSVSNDWCAQGTSTTTYASANCLTSSIDALNAAVSKTAISADAVGKALKMIGDRLGMPFDDNGNLLANAKMNFKVGVLNRLQRRDLVTLKGNW